MGVVGRAGTDGATGGRMNQLQVGDACPRESSLRRAPHADDDGPGRCQHLQLGQRVRINDAGVVIAIHVPVDLQPWIEAGGAHGLVERPRGEAPVLPAHAQVDRPPRATFAREDV